MVNNWFVRLDNPKSLFCLLIHACATLAPDGVMISALPQLVLSILKSPVDDESYIKDVSDNDTIVFTFTDAPPFTHTATPPMPAEDISNVNATLYYFQPPLDGSKPWTQVGLDPKTGERPTNFSTEEKQANIENVRGRETEYGLDTSGFLFYKHQSKFKNFGDDAAIRDEYYNESTELIKKVTGANRVVWFDHTLRRNRPGVPDVSEDTRAPVPRVHVDQTPESAVKRVHMHTSEELAPLLLEHRFQIINLWRPINNPAFDFPLALCDYRTIDWENDLVPTTRISPQRIGETFSVKYNPQHRWKYQRGMTPDEVVLIKCFDSLMDGNTAILTPHTAFIDPTTPKGVPLRESIELRALVFYDNLPSEA